MQTSSGCVKIIEEFKAETKDLTLIFNQYPKENLDLRAKLTKLQGRSCALCDCIFSSDTEFKAHLIEKHDLKSVDEPTYSMQNIVNEYDAMENKRKPEFLVLNTSSEVMYHCDKFDFEYEEEGAVETHKELYHDNNCDICGQTFDEEEELKTHKVTFHMNICDTCDSQVVSMNLQSKKD